MRTGTSSTIYKLLHEKLKIILKNISQTGITLESNSKNINQQKAQNLTKIKASAAVSIRYWTQANVYFQDRKCPTFRMLT